MAPSKKMQLRVRLRAFVWSMCLAPVVALALPGRMEAADFSTVQHQTNGDLLLRLPVPTGQTWRIDASINLQQWEPLATARSVANAIAHPDSAAP
jgi:hypothetical protein